MIVNYENAKKLSELGFHCKSFWIYLDGKKTYTGMDGFDEGEFNFLKDNYLDPVIAEDYEKILINKQLNNVAYPQDHEIICAPETEDVKCWLDSMGIYISILKKSESSIQAMVAGHNFAISKSYNDRITANSDSIENGLIRLKEILKK